MVDVVLRVVTQNPCLGLLPAPCSHHHQRLHKLTLTFFAGLSWPPYPSQGTVIWEACMR